eukprot:113499-Chlamydomonas_euryale.AAC.1
MCLIQHCPLCPPSPHPTPPRFVLQGVGGVKVSKPAASADAAARDAQSLYTAWLEARAAAAGGIGGELTAEAKRLQAILDIPDKTEH